MTHADYDSWRSIQGQQLSRNGKFVAYALVPQDGDARLSFATLRQARSGASHRAQARPPQPTWALLSPLFKSLPPRCLPSPPTVSPSIFTIYPQKAEIDKAKKQKKKPEDMPKNSLGIMDVASGEVARVERVKRFQVPEEGTGFIAYLLEPKPEEKKTEEKKDEKKPEASAPPAAADRKKREKKKEYGSDLVLRNMADKSERVFADVLEFTFSKDAKSLVYAVSSKKEETNGVYAVTPGSTAAQAALLSGAGKYTKLTWDDKQTQLAFISDRDDAAAAQPKFKLYHWDRKSAQAMELVSTATPNFRPGLVLSDKGSIAFSLDGSRLFFGTSRPPEPEKDEDSDAAPDDGP